MDRDWGTFPQGDFLALRATRDPPDQLDFADWDPRSEDGVLPEWGLLQCPMPNMFPEHAQTWSEASLLPPHSDLHPVQGYGRDDERLEPAIVPPNRLCGERESDRETAWGWRQTAVSFH